MVDNAGQSDNEQTGSVLESLGLIVRDQRRINILLSRLVHDMDKRVQALEAGGSVVASAGGARAQLEIGKDVPAYPPSDFEFLKKTEVFGVLSDDALRLIFFKGQVRTVAKGATVFETGKPADTLWVIKKGVVEINRKVDGEMKTVAYFTDSDAIGEMRIITRSPHRSTGRAPGGGEIFYLTREALVECMDLVPEIALRMCEMYAHKLEGTVTTLRTHEQKQRQLEGNLEYFDLATVIQTLLSTDQRTGILFVSNDKQQTVAELFIDQGHVKRATVGALTGEEAFYQLFLKELKRGHFFFKEDVDPTAEAAEIDIPGMSLLMEAARLQDELCAIKSEVITDPGAVLKQKAAALAWDEEETKPIAEVVWRAIGHGMTVQKIVEEIPKNEYTVYNTLLQLVQSGQIG
jgi:CRP-like cAMP-binding protein